MPYFNLFFLSFGAYTYEHVGLYVGLLQYTPLFCFSHAECTVDQGKCAANGQFDASTCSCKCNVGFTGLNCDGKFPFSTESSASDFVTSAPFQSPAWTERTRCAAHEPGRASVSLLKPTNTFRTWLSTARLPVESAVSDSFWNSG